jgi:hypothetical protein
MTIEAIFSGALLLRGFTHHSTSDGRLTYWVFDVPAGVQDQNDPIVFVHGIGIGNFTLINSELAFCRLTSLNIRCHAICPIDTSPAI